MPAGENSAKAINAAYSAATQIQSDDEMIAECRRLREMAKVSLPDEAVTLDTADQLGYELDEEGNYEEAKVFYLAALGRRRRVLGEKTHSLPQFVDELGDLSRGEIEGQVEDARHRQGISAPSDYDKMSSGPPRIMYCPTFPKPKHDFCSDFSLLSFSNFDLYSFIELCIIPTTTFPTSSTPATSTLKPNRFTPHN